MALTSRPLTLALQTLDYPPDPGVSSIGIYTRTLAEALSRRGHNVHVVSRSHDGDSVERQCGVTVHRLGPARTSVPKAMNAATVLRLAAQGFGAEWRYRRQLASLLASLVATQGVQLVEAADCVAEAFFYRRARYPEVPFVVRLHGPTAVHELFDRNTPELVRRTVRSYERQFLLGASHLTAPSEAAKELIAREMGLKHRAITVYPNPPTVELQGIAPAGSEDPNLVLFVGRLTPSKGVERLIRAVPAVLGHNPEARFVLIGPDWPTSRGYRSTREYLLSLLPPRHHHALVFTGYLPHAELGSYYKRAALCVFPSVFEIFGYVCLEAMAYGKAIIGSRHGGMADLLDDGKAGLLYSAADGELSELILRLLNDAPLRRALGQRARQRALEHYSTEVTVSAVEAFYRRAITELGGTNGSLR
jgi:glycogen synthase